MPQCMVVINANQMRYEVDTTEVYPSCSGEVLYETVQSGTDTGDGETNTIVVYEVPPPVDLTDINSGDASALFAAGFGLSLAPFIVTWMVRAILTMIPNRI